jgi:hypothetical protein
MNRGEHYIFNSIEALYAANFFELASSEASTITIELLNLDESLLESLEESYISFLKECPNLDIRFIHKNKPIDELEWIRFSFHRDAEISPDNLAWFNKKINQNLEVVSPQESYRAPALSLQVAFQHQQQQRQQQQQQQQQSSALENYERPAEKEVEYMAGFLGSENIIHREDIWYFENEHFSREEIAEVWDKLLLGTNITCLSEPAWLCILAHWKEFQYGLVLDNLPPGFSYGYLDEEAEEVVLHFDEMAYEQAFDENPLSISIPSPKDLELSISNQELLQESFPDFDFEKTFQRSFSELLKQKDYPENLSEYANALVQELHLDEEKLKVLLCTEGLSGVLEFLRQLETLREKKGEASYQHFKATFLDSAEYYGEFISPEIKEYFEYLLKFNSTELNWWESLSRQHLEAGCHVDFIDLAKAFIYFRDELKEEFLNSGQQFALPFQAPEGLKNMKVGLNRILKILQYSVFKGEQLSYIPQLDLCPFSLSYMENDAFLVTPNMELTTPCTLDMLPREIEFEEEILAYRIIEEETPEIYQELLNQFREKEVKEMFQHPFAIYSYNDPNENLESPVLVALVNGELISRSFGAIEIGKTNSLRRFLRVENERKDFPLFFPYDPRENYFDVLERRDRATNLQYRFLEGLERSVAYFFRYLGQQKYRLPMHFYEEAVQYLFETLETAGCVNRFRLVNFFLSLLAEKMTGVAALEIENPEEIFRDFLELFFEHYLEHDNIFCNACDAWLEAFSDKSPLLFIEFYQYFKKVKDLIPNKLECLFDIGLTETPEVAIKENSLAYFFVRYRDIGLQAIENMEFRFEEEGEELGARIKQELMSPLYRATSYLKSKNCLREEKLEEGREEFLTRFPLLFSLIKFEIKPEDSAEETGNRVGRLIRKFFHLPPSNYMMLLDLLCEINLERSSGQLPSFGQIYKIVKDAARLPEGLPTDELEVALNEIIERHIPNIFLGHGAVEVVMGEATQLFFNTFLGLFKKAGLNNRDKIQKNFTDLLENAEIPAFLKRPVNKIKNNLSNNLSAFLEALQTEDMRAASMRLFDIDKQFSFLSGFPVASGFAQTAKKEIFDLLRLSDTALEGEDEELQLTIVTFFLVQLEAFFKDKLEKRICRVFTGNENFQRLKEHLVNFLGEFPEEVGAEELGEALEVYSERLNLIRDFASGIAEIRTRDEALFMEVMDLLCNQYLDHLNLDQHAAILSLNQYAHFMGINCISEVYHYLSRIEGADFGEAFYFLKEDFEYLENQNLAKEDARALLEAVLNYKKEVGMDGLSLTVQSLAEQAVDQNGKVDAEFLPFFIEMSKSDPDLAKRLIQLSSAYKEDIPEITVFLKCLGLSTLEGGCIDQVNRFLDLISLEEDEEVLTDVLSVIISFSLSSGKRLTSEEIEQLSRCYTQLANFSQESIESLSKLKGYKKQPAIAQILNILEEAEIETFVKQFDQDPFSNRDNLINPLDTGNISGYLAEIGVDIENTSHTQLLKEQQLNLAREQTYVNYIAQEYSEKTRDELRVEAQMLIQALRNAPEGEVKPLQLQLLGLSCEAYFRATGKFPYPIQVLSVLLSLEPKNLSMQINTGEGKGLTSALLAVMDYALKGKAYVTTSDSALVDQDYFGKNNDGFFDLLGIPSGIIQAESDLNDEGMEGVYYTTLSDLALYHDRLQIVNGEIFNYENCGFVLDEVDQTLLDDRTAFDYATQTEGEMGVNPHEALYPMINQFMVSPKFQYSAKPSIQVRALRNFIFEQVEQEESLYFNPKALSKISDDRLNIWLESALITENLKEGDDFILVEGDFVSDRVIVPLDQNGQPKPGAIFPDGIQQLLAARLQTEFPDLNFRIDPELTSLAKKIAPTLINSAISDGARMLGVSGSAARTAEEMAYAYPGLSFETYRIPPNKESLREYLVGEIAKEFSAHIQRISHNLKSQTLLNDQAQRQPVLLLCEKNSEAEKYEQALLRLSIFEDEFELQRITGEETKEELARKMKKAAEPNVVTLGTRFMGRGKDFSTQHPAGLLVMPIIPVTERVLTQFMGRAARNGKSGRVFECYNRQDLIRIGKSCGVVDVDHLEKRALLEAVQAGMSRCESVEHYYRQAADERMNAAIRLFDHWYHFLLNALPNERPQLDSDLLNLKGTLIHQLKRDWDKILEASNPNRQYANPYVRLNASGELETSELDVCVESYELAIEERWEKLISSPEFSHYLHLSKDRLSIEVGVIDLRLSLEDYFNFKDGLDLQEATWDNFEEGKSIVMDIFSFIKDEDELGALSNEIERCGQEENAISALTQLFEVTQLLLECYGVIDEAALNGLINRTPAIELAEFQENKAIQERIDRENRIASEAEINCILGTPSDARLTFELLDNKALKKLRLARARESLQLIYQNYPNRFEGVNLDLSDLTLQGLIDSFNRVLLAFSFDQEENHNFEAWIEIVRFIPMLPKDSWFDGLINEDKQEEALQESLEELKENLENVRETYLNVAFEKCIQALQSELSWANPESRGLSYYFEPRAIRKSAESVHRLIDDFNQDPLGDCQGLSLDKKIKEVYKSIYNARIDKGSPFTLSLGHRNVDRVMEDTLNRLERLYEMETGKPALEFREEVLVEIAWDRFFKVFDENLNRTLERASSEFSHRRIKNQWENREKWIEEIQKAFPNKITSLRYLKAFIDRESYKSKNNQSMYKPLKRFLDRYFSKLENYLPEDKAQALLREVEQFDLQVINDLKPEVMKNEENQLGFFSPDPQERHVALIKDEIISLKNILHSLDQRDIKEDALPDLGFKNQEAIVNKIEKLESNLNFLVSPDKYDEDISYEDGNSDDLSDEDDISNFFKQF